jgi:hypothetical protein
VNGRHAKDKRVAEWMRIRKAKITCEEAEVMMPVSHRGAKASTETQKVAVTLYLVTFTTGHLDAQGGFEWAEAYGSPAGTIEEALAAAMKRFPLPKQEAATPVPAVAELVAEDIAHYSAPEVGDAIGDCADLDF